MSGEASKANVGVLNQETAVRGESEVNDQNVTEPGLSKDEAFDVLRNSRRRSVISCLRAHGQAMSVKEVTRCVASEEYDVPVEELTAKQTKRVYTGLYQCHLERMDEIGVIDFDKDDNTVSLSEAAADLEPYYNDGVDPARAELAVAAVVALVVTLGSIGVGPFGAIPIQWLAVLTTVTLLGLALFQLYD